MIYYIILFHRILLGTNIIITCVGWRDLESRSYVGSKKVKLPHPIIRFHLITALLKKMLRKNDSTTVTLTVQSEVIVRKGF